MSLTPHAQQAIQWLEQQLTDLSGIRNATPRDPSFKNWRQATLTVMQRIWPTDQDRQERFRRIPFSPADPRADARTVREWYARGCQEAARVLAGFINDIHAQDVPKPASDVASKPSSGEFSVDFPTVDLPSSQADAELPALSAETDDILRALGSPSGESTRVPFAPAPQGPVPIMAPSVFARVTAHTPPPPAAAPAPPPPAPAPVAASPTVEARQSKKGVGARLRDLLGFAQLSAKAFTGTPREQAPAPPLRPHVSPPPPPPPPPPPSSQGLEIIPVGDEVTPARRTPAPLSSAPSQRAASAHVSPAPASAPGPVSPPVFGAVPPLPPDETREPGMSVVMSRPTTLRTSIEKVSIESLISPEFRNDAAADAPAPAPDPLSTPHLQRMTPAEALSPTANSGMVEPEPSPFLEPELPPPAATPSAVESMAPVIDLGPPAELVVPPPPSQSMPALTPSSASIPAPTPSQSMPAPSRADLPFAQPSAIIPMPSLPAAPEAEPPREAVAPVTEPASAREKVSKVVPMPKRAKQIAKKPVVEEPIQSEEPDATEDHISAEMPVDPEEFAQATEDFMRSSPVLGATGRRVKRGYDDRDQGPPRFEDPDAIAIASLLDEFDAIGVPTARHPEARARLLDLARRLEKGELEWAALRKAVWFAMEYPELARRVMPLLLPWIDRAA